ncbi:unnamed protein product [Protopolystoma xenopodis]|uniref:Nuclear pore protein n=1 Tax=Protopolystoma xenopodis TaxID=117903 RepID=A0A3S5B3W7_9PLAT|nr:unnamed protein product [Protopolystoma xenopodis]
MLDGLVDSKPVWMMIYFCLRAGDLKDAIEIARSATNNLGDFYLTLSEFSKNNRKIPAHLLPTIIEHYNRSVKNSTDFYKRCVFCVLCRFDLDDLHLSVARSVDDFLWLRLSQVELLTGHTQLKATPNHSHLKKMTKQEDVLCLASLQSLISETYGEAHFDAWHQPLLYFKILLLTQQFEAALAFLGRFDAFRSHSVHVALALHDLGLLVPSLTVQASTISRIDSDPPGFHRLNLARLLLLYTRKFELTNPREALNYYYFLSGIHLTNSSSKQPSHFSAMGASSAGGLLYLLGAPGLKWPLERGTDTGGCLPLQKKDVTDDDSEELTDDEDDEDRFRGGLHGKGIIYFSEKSLFVLCTCELALATKEFTTLFGYLDESGLRKPGAIDRFCPNEAACEQLIVYIAKRVEATGQLVHAVRLYQLAAAICSSAISTTSSDFFVHSMPRHPSSAANMLDLILDERRRHHLISATRLVNSLLVNALVTGAMGVSVPTGSVWTEEVLSTDYHKENSIISL